MRTRGKRKSIISNNQQQNMDSYRCNACSIEFSVVEELLVHSEDAHEGEVTVQCNRCDLEFVSVSDIISHHEDVHNDSDLKGELKANGDTSDQVDVNDDDQISRITIINDDGETIGIADNPEEEIDSTTEQHSPNVNNNDVPTLALNNVPSATLSSSRKRRPPQKYREQQDESTPAKRPVINNSLLYNKEDVEIDISNLSSIRLRCDGGSGGGNGGGRDVEILNYLKQVDEKLDCIIKHFNVPFKSSQKLFTETIESPVHSLLKRTARKSWSSSRYEAKLNSSPSGISHRTRGSYADASPNSESVTFISCDGPPQEITQYVISDDLCEATYLKSRNRGNFSKNLVYAAFPLEERLGRNCYGKRGGSLSGPKEPLEPAKLAAVREAVFKKFPILDGDDEEAVWKKECVIAIDTALRSEMRSRILGMQMRNDSKSSDLTNMPM